MVWNFFSSLCRMYTISLTFSLFQMRTQESKCMGQQSNVTIELMGHLSAIRKHSYRAKKTFSSSRIEVNKIILMRFKTPCDLSILSSKPEDLKIFKNVLILIL